MKKVKDLFKSVAKFEKKNGIKKPDMSEAKQPKLKLNKKMAADKEI